MAFLARLRRTGVSRELSVTDPGGKASPRLTGGRGLCRENAREAVEQEGQSSGWAELLWEDCVVGDDESRNCRARSPNRESLRSEANTGVSCIVGGNKLRCPRAWCVICASKVGGEFAVKYIGPVPPCQIQVVVKLSSHTSLHSAHPYTACGSSSPTKTGAPVLSTPTM